MAGLFYFFFTVTFHMSSKDSLMVYFLFCKIVSALPPGRTPPRLNGHLLPFNKASYLPLMGTKIKKLRSDHQIRNQQAAFVFQRFTFFGFETFSFLVFISSLVDYDVWMADHVKEGSLVSYETFLKQKSSVEAIHKIV